MKVHFIAIGGTAMHNLAIALHINGYEVSGSDDEVFEPSKSRLSAYGLLPEKMGWFPERITSDIDFLILGMHAKPDNPELKHAIETGVKIYSYPEFLYAHAQDKLRVVIAGSHGKTTITAMVMHVLKQKKQEFDYLVGSKLKDFDVMVKLSNEAEVMVFEGDEYLSSPIDRRPKFHWYRPQIALLSGIAWDHINVFPTFENYLEQFRIFIGQMEAGSTLVYYEEDVHIIELLKGINPEIKTVSYAVPDYEIVEGNTRLFIDHTAYNLKVFGRHNLMNLNGARLVCNALGITNKDFGEAIESFDGTANRLELVCKNASGVVYKDFAHAPSKVKATVHAVKEQFPDSSLVACLELHTFSSLNKEFLSEYKDSFEYADVACVYFNPHALKMKAMADLDPHDIISSFGKKDLRVFSDAGELFDFLKGIKHGHRTFLLMSSGNFDGVNIKEISKVLI